MREEPKYRTRNVEVTYEMLLGERLRYYRLDQQMSQMDLAARSGVLQPTISRIERGACSATVEDVRSLCRALGLAFVYVVQVVDSQWDKL